MNSLCPTLHARINYLIHHHGGLRALARTIDVAPSYISRLRRGLLKNPKDAFLKKIGLEIESQITTYRNTKEWRRYK